MTLPIRSVAEQATNTVAGTTVGLTVLGVNMQDWAAIAAFSWICLQAGYWLYTKIKTKKEPQEV